MLDLTTLEKVGNFPHLKDLIRVYNHKKGLHIVIMYLVIGHWRFPWSFRIYRGKGTASPSQLAQKLINNLPSILTQSFKIYILGDTAFGTIKLISKIRNSLKFHTIVGIPKTRKLQDGRKVSELKTRGQQVYLNGRLYSCFFVMGLVKTRWQESSTFCDIYKTNERYNYYQMGTTKMANRRIFQNR